MAIDLFYIAAILTALVAYGLYSSVYKWNPLSNLMQCMVTGVGLAVIFTENSKSFLTKNWVPLLGTPTAAPDLLMLGPMILGALYFTFFIPKLAGAYRMILAINLANSFGVLLPISFSILWSWIKGFAAGAATLDIGKFIAMICLILGISNFLFSARMDKPFRIPRTLGRYILFSFAGTTAIQVFTGNSNMLMYNSIDVWTGPAWWVVVVIFAFVMADAVGALSPLKQRLLKPAKATV